MENLGNFASNFDLFNEKSVLITGGTGSFGKKFINQILENSSPKRLIIFSRDELKQYELQKELESHERKNALRFFIGDVRDLPRLEMAFRDVDFVIHAAALKQVPTAEYNPFECIRTNVIGAENVVHAAIKCGVSKIIALSTDKAASPANLYGASKLASDKIFVSGNYLAGIGNTKFSVVRYGNVIGSRGSVVPLFYDLINNGKTELPITDERMTRFWITIGQGVKFVVSNFNLMQGGEIFVPKIPSMKIVDLATAMAPHLVHKIIGIRPGEKLHETMITEDDARNTIEMSDRYVVLPQFRNKDKKDFYDINSKAVPEGFIYSSDNNSQWLDAKKLLSYLKDK